MQPKNRSDFCPCQVHCRAKYRILNLGKSGRKTASEIAKKVDVSTSKVVAILKKAGIAIVTKEAKAKAEAEKKAAKKNQKSKKDETPAPEATTPAPEATEPVAETPCDEVPVAEEELALEATEDTAAMEAAMADMADEETPEA